MWSKTMKIMICSQDTMMTQRLQKIVNSMGHETAPCTGELDRLKLTRPDVLMLSLDTHNLEELCAFATNPKNPNPAIILMGREELCDIRSFRLGASDFLPLPIVVEDVQASLHKIMQINAAQKSQLIKKSAEKHVRQYISARTHRGVELMPLSEVYYFAADQKYVKVRHKSGMMLIDETLKDLEKEFGDFLFRIHRNALVNLEYLDVLETPSAGQHQVRFRGLNDALCVSRRHLPALRDKISSI